MTHYLTIKAYETECDIPSSENPLWYRMRRPWKIDSYINLSGAYHYDNIISINTFLVCMDDACGETNGPVRWSGPEQDTRFGLEARDMDLPYQNADCSTRFQQYFLYVMIRYPGWPCGVMATSRD